MKNIEYECFDCNHFDEDNDICTKFHFNVKSYPKKYVKKCNGKYFEGGKISENIAHIRLTCEHCRKETNAYIVETGEALNERERGVCEKLNKNMKPFIEYTSGDVWGKCWKFGDAS